MSSRITLSLVLIVVALAVVACGTPTNGPDAPVNTSAGFTGPGPALALHGYDAVAYFEAQAPERGSHQHSTTHAGATYRFASAERLAAFEANPDRYAPQFGGYCAYGASVSKKFDGDPTQWAVVEDKLYLNLNPDIRAIWVEDRDENIAKAEGAWPKIRDTPPGAL